MCVSLARTPSLFLNWEVSRGRANSPVPAASPSLRPLPRPPNLLSSEALCLRKLFQLEIPPPQQTPKAALLVLIDLLQENPGGGGEGEDGKCCLYRETGGRRLKMPAARPSSLSPVPSPWEP